MGKKTEHVFPGQPGGTKKAEQQEFMERHSSSEEHWEGWTEALIDFKVSGLTSELDAMD
jgi:hypothetical protein